MTLSTIVSAAPALQKLIQQDLPLPIAWELTRLIDVCNPALEFFDSERAKILCGAPELQASRTAELLAMSAPGMGPTLVVRIPLDAGLRLSAADIKALQPLVLFEEAPHA